jgi:hypothetical protein
MAVTDPVFTGIANIKTIGWCEVTRDRIFYPPSRRATMKY